MIKKLCLLIACLAFFLPSPAAAQTGISTGSGPPIGTCAGGNPVYVDVTTGYAYTCKAGKWVSFITNYNFLSPMGAALDPTGATDIVCANCQNVQNNAQNANQIISGGQVEWVANYNFTVGAAVYSISGVNYSSPLTNLTLQPADPVNDRIDVIAVNNAGQVVILQGVPAGTPQQPTIDPTTQLELTFVYVTAASTAPTQITKDDIYHSNTEWTTARSPNTNPPWNLASTNNPYDTTVDIEATNAALNGFVSMTVPASGTVDLGTVNNLVFYIRSKATWNAARSITIQWFNGATAKGQGVVLRDGTFGFSSSITNAYQQVAIPTSSFGIAGVPVTAVRFTVSGTGATTIGFYLDNITLQGGAATSTLPTGVMIYRGAWASTTAYNQNDVASSGAGAYVAIAAGTNHPPVTSSTFWTPVYSPKLRCSGGLGDGLNAIAGGTYSQTTCVNTSGATWTITGISCYTDNAGSSTLQAANNAGTNLLTAPVTCNNTKSGGGAAGTQSATVTLANNDSITFTFAADGTSTQANFTVSMTQ